MSRYVKPANWSTAAFSLGPTARSGSATDDPKLTPVYAAGAPLGLVP